MDDPGSGRRPGRRRPRAVYIVAVLAFVWFLAGVILWRTQNPDEVRLDSMEAFGYFILGVVLVGGWICLLVREVDPDGWAWITKWVEKWMNDTRTGRRM